MYSAFELFIKDFVDKNASEDFWYDCAILDGIEMLKQFTEKDWQLLLENLHSKSILWKQRLIECLGDINNLYEVKVISEVISTEDHDLFISCVDSLRSLNLSELNIVIKEELLAKLNLIVITASRPEKGVIKDLIQKLSV